ncbi:MAG: cyclic pyranopterin monophosphate synthase MoaC [Lentisphaerae bacterium]|nr:MAG: cyclic pyranopterin monophosphate synthase MoaC [Lentisphaerota bacterium]
MPTNEDGALTHIGEDGRPTMVDVSPKPQSCRRALATGSITLSSHTRERIRSNTIAKGNVLITAELAGTMAAKQTANLIPLCHNIVLSQVTVKATLTSEGVDVQAEARCTGQTGVEMEALTATSVALLTIYDMCKAIDKNMVIGPIRLIEKTKTPLTATNSGDRQ